MEVYTVIDLLNELKDVDPSTPLHITSTMESGRSWSYSNSQSTSFEVDVIDNDSDYQELFTLGEDDDEDDENDVPPKFPGKVIHISISGEETGYE